MDFSIFKDIKINGLGITQLSFNNKIVWKQQETFDKFAIYYTTTDGKIITPQQAYLNATIKSNTYSNGQGIITFDTPLTATLDASTAQQGAFRNCTNLETIIFPESFEHLGIRSLIGCTNLKEVTFKDRFNYIGNYGISGTKLLTRINCYSEKEPTISGANALNISVVNNGVLHFPKGSNYSTWLNSTNLGKWGWSGVDDLPISSPYIYVSSVSNPNGAYVNIGLYFSNGCRYVYKANFTTYNTHVVSIKDSGNVGRMVCFPTSATAFTVNKETNTHTAISVPSIANTDIVVDFNCLGSNKIFKLDDVTKMNLTNTGALSKCSMPMQFFRNNTNIFSNNNKLYYVQVYDDKGLVANFVPVVRRADNKVGFLNTLNDSFITSANNKELVANYE